MRPCGCGLTGCVAWLNRFIVLVLKGSAAFLICIACDVLPQWVKPCFGHGHRGVLKNFFPFFSMCVCGKEEA